MTTDRLVGRFSGFDPVVQVVHPGHHVERDLDDEGWQCGCGPWHVEGNRVERVVEEQQQRRRADVVGHHP
jgi:hypothetical protein